MSDQYPRVMHYGAPGSAEDRYLPAGSGPHKVVPADAIVIEPLDFGDEQARSIAANELGYAPRISADLARLHEQVIYLASALARLQKHPPVDEAQVEALAEDMIMAGASAPVSEGDSEAFSRAMDDIARRLVEQGWTKPEPTP